MPIEDLKKGTLVIKFLFSCFARMIMAHWKNFGGNGSNGSNGLSDGVPGRH